MTLADLIVGFASELRALNLDLRIKGKKLQVIDVDEKIAWTQLTKEQQDFVRAFRQELKTFLLTGVLPQEPKKGEHSESPHLTVSHSDAPPNPVPTPVDPDASLREQAPDVWRVVHGNEPTEAERRRQEMTRVMYRTLHKRSPWL